MNWWQDKVAVPCVDSAEEARTRQLQLTKPAGSLGRLEALAIDLAGYQGRALPQLQQVLIRIFAADHGVARAGVSAFPQSVTAQMIDNFAGGGAAIAVLARQWRADFQVVNMGTAHAVAAQAGVIDRQLAPGTENFCEAAAMTGEQLDAALAAGAEQLATPCDVFVGGEMGIGNSTVAAALAACVLDLPAARLVGPGTGVDQAGVEHKREVVAQALARHQSSCHSAYDTLRCLGGFEIAALCGAYVRAAQLGIPVLVDGFISSVAALLACRLNADVRQWLLFSHESAEPGHALILAAMEAKPLLNLGLRLGEGSGAAVALSLLRDACLLHSQMATFAEAGVSDSDSDSDSDNDRGEH